jgi:transcriptional regulator of arginine metabolism
VSKRVEDIQKRHAVIKSLISGRDIPSQTHLAKALRSEGIKVTQATLSRDLTELGIVRVPYDGGHRYELRPTGAENALKVHLAEEILSVESNECQIVLKTFPGRAAGVAVMLDKQEDPDILGTIAGDDTVLVLPRSVKRIKQTKEQVEHYTGVR